MTKNKKIQVFKNSGGKWQWQLRWANGEIGAHSEMYTTKHGARKSAFKIFCDLCAGSNDWNYEIERKRCF